jgi:hypothetical protein
MVAIAGLPLWRTQLLIHHHNMRNLLVCYCFLLSTIINWKPYFHCFDPPSWHEKLALLSLLLAEHSHQLETSFSPFSAKQRTILLWSLTPARSCSLHSDLNGSRVACMADGEEAVDAEGGGGEPSFVPVFLLTASLTVALPRRLLDRRLWCYCRWLAQIWWCSRLLAWQYRSFPHRHRCFPRRNRPPPPDLAL